MWGCGEVSSRIREHLLLHVPEYFRPCRAHSGKKFDRALRLIVAALCFVVQCLFGEGAQEFR